MADYAYATVDDDEEMKENAEKITTYIWCDEQEQALTYQHIEARSLIARRSK